MIEKYTCFKSDTQPSKMNELFNEFHSQLNEFTIESVHRVTMTQMKYGRDGEMAQKVIEGDMSHAKSYA